MGFLLQVNQPNDFVLVQRQQDRLGILAPIGAEGINLWCATAPPLFQRFFRFPFPWVMEVFPRWLMGLFRYLDSLSMSISVTARHEYAAKRNTNSTAAVTSELFIQFFHLCRRLPGVLHSNAVLGMRVCQVQHTQEYPF